jgi:pyruvate kinase
MNFSHGTHEEHEKTFRLVRELSAQYDEQVSVICDIQGPKIRTGRMKQAFTVKPGDTIRVTPEKIEGTPERISIKYPTIVQDLDPGETIFINDGVIRLKVVEKQANDLVCTVEAGGTISDHKGCNIPSGKISMEVITEKDREDLKFIAKLGPEFVAASFIGTAEDVRKIKRTLAEFGNPDIKVISKIERPVALQNLEAIVKESDALMVARGDLGVEIPTHEVPIAQKRMVRLCNAEGKPVIVATQMLESMVNQARPTRAEANDVFNAVLDGADAVMLSAETSVGKYPLQTVKVMDDIISAAEPYLPIRRPGDFDSSFLGMTETIGHSVYTICKQFSKMKYTGKIIVIADSGYTARMVSKYRPLLDIIAISADLRTARELNLVWGIRTVFSKDCAGPNVEDRAVKAIKKALELHLITEEDHVVVVSRTQLGKHVGSFTGILDVKKVVTGQKE